MRKFFINFSISILSCSIVLAGSKILDEGEDYLAEQGKSKAVKYTKNGARSVLDKIPGGKFISDLIFDGGDSMEDRVERIDKNQKTGLSQLKELSQKVLSSKRKIESIYYFKARSLRDGQGLAKKLKDVKNKNLLLAGLENWLDIPLNAADYIPNIPENKEVRESVKNDLSKERSVLRSTKSLLTNTRSAVASMIPGTMTEKDREEFNMKYSAAARHDKLILEGVKAKRQELVRTYNEEIRELVEEIKILKESKNAPGTDRTKLVQIETLIELKLARLGMMSKYVDKEIARAAQPSEEERADIAVVQMQEVLRNIEARLQQERKAGRPFFANASKVKRKEKKR